jgi:tRNA threonylcarbamoyladenosine biosynthesis protein TsaE
VCCDLRSSAFISGKLLSVTQQNLTRYVTHSPEETIALGRELAKDLTPPKLVLLRGELGAGKTTLVKGIAEAFEAAEQEEVTSPTFTLIHEYRGPKVTIYHIDLYRIETERELATLGIDELLRDPSALMLIEWGEKFPRFVRERDVEIAIERVSETERRIDIATAQPISGHEGPQPSLTRD